MHPDSAPAPKLRRSPLVRGWHNLAARSAVFVPVITLAFALVACGPVTPDRDPLVVDTSAGTVRGFNQEEGVVAFRGIPFAAPPVAGLRWKAPQPPVPWRGIREATEFGPDCMQYPYVPRNTPMSEDCLYLNVYRPARARAGDALPVHVWIYGGAFLAGASSLPAYDNAGDVRDGIVYVNFNYRVNVFGFLAHPGLTADSPHGASGNYGLMDEIAALKWVQENIEQFGGDPSKVTVSGGSAGASSIGFLLISPLGRGLFQRVLMESTAGWHPQRNLAQQEEWAVEKFGADLDHLRNLDAAKLLALTAGPTGKRDGTDTLGDGHSGPFSFIDWLPIVDGHVLPKSDRQAWHDGDFQTVDMIIGDNENEGYLFMGFGPPISLTRDAYEKYMRAEYGALGNEALEIYPVKSDSDVGYQLGLATGDILFQLPAREMARRMAARPVNGTANVYRYHFTKHTATSPVAVHSAERPYFFGDLEGDEAYDASDHALAEQMQRAKRRFIKTGNPNGEGLPHWPAYNANDPYMEFGDAGAVAGTGLRNASLDFAIKALDRKFPLKSD